MEAIVFAKSATFAVSLAILGASGCASFPARDPALDDAQLSLDAARRNPQVAMYAASELDQAASTLRQADDLAATGGRYDDVHRLALLAAQRAAAAQDAARVRSEQAALSAQRMATDARIRASVTQQQAAAAQVQAAEAQRQADEAQRLAAAASAPYDYSRRPNEVLYEVPVTSVRAVVGPPQQRCWVERQVVDAGTSGINVPGAVVGGVVGGILGHQIGSGHGRDVATGIGAATGAVVGANVGSEAPGTVYTQDVQHCETIPAAARVDYWDVTYNFRGYENHVQMTSPPGATILVNAQGEPRV
ncbi:MAG TPA: glycine zipper 2TM domain-containing protein [Casimicrobiaceae bacterium]|nr:glycine zipper 2TM domain-containing protein [Casimicrobiaceae bacterium]